MIPSSCRVIGLTTINLLTPGTANRSTTVRRLSWRETTWARVDVATGWHWPDRTGPPTDDGPPPGNTLNVKAATLQQRQQMRLTIMPNVLQRLSIKSTFVQQHHKGQASIHFFASWEEHIGTLSETVEQRKPITRQTTQERQLKMEISPKAPANADLKEDSNQRRLPSTMSITLSRPKHETVASWKNHLNPLLLSLPTSKVGSAFHDIRSLCCPTTCWDRKHVISQSSCQSTTKRCKGYNKDWAFNWSSPFLDIAR